MNETDRALAEQSQLFSGTDFSSVEYMLENCSIVNLPTGECLLQPNVPNYHLYLILKGKLGVHLAVQASPELATQGNGKSPKSGIGSDSQTLVLATLGSGECVGEISLVDGMHPSALVIAIEPTCVLSIPHDTVWSLVDHSHEIARNLLGIVAGRMRDEKHALVTSQGKKKIFQNQAHVDALTGVHNRHWMADTFTRTLHRCELGNSPSVVMMMDVDHFKRINDSYGHLVGDITLQTIAKCIIDHLRPHDLLVRYGGEEFAVLLPDTDLNQAKNIAERLRTAIADATIHHDELSFQVTISIGLTSAQTGKELEDLISEADKALYRAKESGRNRIEIFG